MGIIPIPTEYGPDCALCWPPGETPTVMKLFLSGIKTGNDWGPSLGPAPNGYHDVGSNPLTPCSFGNIDPGWPKINVHFFAGQTICWLKVNWLHFAFVVDVAETCAFAWDNQITGPVGNAFYGGQGNIMSVTQLSSFISSITPLNDPNPRMENFPVSKTQSVIRYAGKRDATNIQIKVDYS